MRGTRVALGDAAERSLQLAADLDPGMSSGTVHLEVEGPGRLRLDGFVDLHGASDLELELASFPLASLRPLLPSSLRPAGSVSARVHLDGPPSEPRLRARVSARRLTLAGGPLGDLDLHGRLADGRAEASLSVRGPLARRLSLKVAVPMRVDLTARAWSVDPGAARAELWTRDLRLFHFTPWLPELRPRGRVDGFLRLTGRGAGDPWITGTWRTRGLAFGRMRFGDLEASFEHHGDLLRGAVELRRCGARASLDVELPLALDPSRGTITWRRDREHRGSLRITDLKLGQVLPDLRGVLDGELEFRGPASAPVVRAELRADDILYRGVCLGSSELRATMSRGATELLLSGDGGRLGELRVHAQAPVALGVDGLSWRREGWHVAEVRAAGLDLGAVGRLFGVDLAGRATLDLDFDGMRRDHRLAASLRAEGLAYAGRPIGRLGAELALRDGRLDLLGRGRLGRRTFVRFGAQLPVDLDLVTLASGWRPEGTTTLDLVATGIDDDALAPLAVVPRQVVRSLDLEVHGQLDRGRIQGTARASGELGSETLPALPLVARLEVDDAGPNLRAHLGGRAAAGSLDLELAAGVSVPALLRGEGELLAASARGALQARGVDLRYFSRALPHSFQDLTGTLSAELDLTGSLGRPLVHGSARVRGGGLTLVLLQQRLSDVEVDVTAAGHALTVERAAAVSGRGTLRARGSARLVDGGEVFAGVRLDARQFPVVRPGWPQMMVDADVRVDLRSGRDALDLGVTIRDAGVWVSDFTSRAPKPIPTNPNVTIVAGPLTASGPGPAEVTHGAAARATQIRVVLAEPVHLQGPSMDMRWRGSIAERASGESTQASGTLDVDRGWFELLGTRFTIDEGRASLPPEGSALDPFLDLIARATVDTYEVAVTLRGRVSRPELHLSSRPQLTESQIFSLLLTGGVDTNNVDPARAQASAAGLLLSFSNPTLARLADQRLGIDRIKFGFADDLSQPVLTIGKYITRSLYAETSYHHNAPPRENRIQVRVEYLISPRWSIESSYGDAAVGNLDLFWRRIFGLRRPLAALHGGGLLAPEVTRSRGSRAALDMKARP